MGICIIVIYHRTITEIHFIILSYSTFVPSVYNTVTSHPIGAYCSYFTRLGLVKYGLIIRTSKACSNYRVFIYSATILKSCKLETEVVI